MSPRALDLVIVPWDVDRADTGMARGPHGLLARGFAERLRTAGREVREIHVGLDAGASSRLEVTASLGRGIARAVAGARAGGRLPLVLSGGCLSALGAVAGLQAAGDAPGAVWIDAHGDFNTPETSRSGYWDGMALAALCGLALPELAAAVGLHPLAVSGAFHLAGRDFDPPELGNVRGHGLARVPPDAVGTEETRERLRGLVRERGSLYLHVDLDGLDPDDAPAVGFPVPCGARLDDLLTALSAVPPPAALTLSALSFERADEVQAERTLATALRLAEAAARG